MDKRVKTITCNIARGVDLVFNVDEAQMTSFDKRFLAGVVDAMRVAYERAVSRYPRANRPASEGRRS